MVADKQSCSPENLKGVANELRKLANQIETGQVTVGGVTLSICNTVSLKMKQKLVGGQVKFDVSLTASLVDSAPPSTDQSQIPQKTKATKKSKIKKKSRSYEVKKIKKTMALQWKQMSNAIAASKMPSTALVDEFYGICEEYGHMAESEWHPLWQELVENIKQLISLAQEGNFQDASQLITTINNQKKSCHKKFK
ncbi:MAG: GAK system XXXCH domain-containing protein [Thermodesulfobacteriota bacterium]